MTKEDKMDKIYERINELSLRLYDNSIKAFSGLDELDRLTVNVRILTAKMSTDDSNGLSRAGHIIKDGIVEIEKFTEDSRNISKELGSIVKKLRELK